MKSCVLNTWLWVSKVSTGKLVLPSVSPHPPKPLARRVQRRVWRRLGRTRPGSHGLGVAEDPHREVLDVSRPLGGELEELDVVPLDSVDGDWGREETARWTLLYWGCRSRGGQQGAAWPRLSAALTSQHGVLVLGGADQSADAVDDLALRVQLFLLGLLAEENHCEGTETVRGLETTTFFILW